MKSSWKIAKSVTDLKSFLQVTIERSNFELSQIKLFEQQEK